MSEVGINIKGDASGLQKAAKDSIKATGEIGDAAKKVQKDLDKVRKAQEKAAQIVREITGRSASEARADVDRFRSSLNESANAARVAGDDFSDAADSLSDIGSVASRGSSALTALGGVLVGSLGTVALSLIEVGIDSLGDKLVESFNRGKKAAEEARVVFEAALGSALKFTPDATVDVQFEGNRQATVDAFNKSTAALNTLKQALKDIKGPLGGTLGDLETGLRDVIERVKNGKAFTEFFDQVKSSGEGIVETRRGLISLTEQEIDREQALNDKLRDRVALLDAEVQIRQRAAEILPVGLNAGELDIDTDISFLFDDSVTKRAEQAAKEFEKARLDNIRAAIGLNAEEQKLKETLAQQNIAAAEAKKLAEERAIANGMLTQSEREVQEAIKQAIEAQNEAFTTSLNAVDFWATGALNAIGDIITGFESIRDIGSIVSNIVRNLARDLIVAAGKAAILNALTGGTGLVGGASGFGGFFKAFLGLKPFATGGIVTGPTPALIGEAGPEAVIPLSKLSSLMQPQVVVVGGTMRYDGRDFLVDLRDISNRRDSGPSISFNS